LDYEEGGENPDYLGSSDSEGKPNGDGR